MSPMIRAGAEDNALLRSIEATYRLLRYGLGAAAFALPLLLYFGGRVRGVPLQASMSAYYHTNMRDVFVGVLFGAAWALILYRGFSRGEDWALNLAGAFGMLVALVPSPPTGRFSLHGTSAVLFFACLAYVAIFRPGDTLPLLKDPKRAGTYRATYRVLGALMVIFPLVAAALASIWPSPAGAERPVIFSVELGAIYAWAAFWIVKSREIRAIQKQQDKEGGPAGARSMRREPGEAPALASVERPV